MLLFFVPSSFDGGWEDSERYEEDEFEGEDRDDVEQDGHGPMYVVVSFMSSCFVLYSV